MTEEEIRILKQIESVTYGIYNFQDQMAAIAKWIASEFERKEYL